MDLQPDEPVGDVRAGLLKAFGPADVGSLIEPGLQLHQNSHLLALLGGGDQRIDYRAVAGRAVDGELDRQHRRVFCGLAYQLHHRLAERRIRVVHQHIAGSQHAEQVAWLVVSAALCERRLGDALPPGPAQIAAGQ